MTPCWLQRLFKAASRSKPTPVTSELPIFSDVALCVRSFGVKQKKGPTQGGPCRSDMKDFNQGASFIPVSMVTRRTQTQAAFFFFPLGSSQSRRVETVAALQVGRTPAAAFYQSQRQPLPGAQRRDGLQFSNLMVQDNLKVFPQVGSHLQYELGRRQQASRVGFMNSFKSSC